MNKKSILLILSSTLALGANAQGKYTINGNLLNADRQKIYQEVLAKVRPGKPAPDFTAKDIISEAKTEKVKQDSKLA